MDYWVLLHPKLVHFPIALISTALILELISLIFRKEQFHQAAIIIFVMAALFSIPTVLSGQAEEKRLNLHHPLLELHEKYALIFMYLSCSGMVLLAVAKKVLPEVFKPIFLLLLLGLVGAVLFVGFYGGQMVYEYGVGVK